MVRKQLIDRGIRDVATLEAMSAVPREAFVSDELRARAYDDRALGIGRGQTISQPYMVARMTACLGVSSLGWPWTGDPPTMLDVGTGSGYQAAVLASLGARVISLERDAQLAKDARDRLESLGYAVEVIVADGSNGYPAGAPYAGIIVGAAAPTVPRPLLPQLAVGGHLVVPVGSRRAQQLTIISRVDDEFETQTADACVFVPLIGANGYDR